MRARLVRIAELIETVGLPTVRESHVRHDEGRFGRFASRPDRDREGAVRDRSGTARGHRARVHKETDKTPIREIELALQRAKELNR